jgi:YVTN family beta-propeller protein
MLLSPDGSILYVACYGSGKIYVIDTNTEAVIGIIGVGNGPFAMALSQTDHYLYVLNYNDNSLDVVDLNNFTVVDTLK